MSSHHLHLYNGGKGCRFLHSLPLCDYITCSVASCLSLARLCLTKGVISDNRCKYVYVRIQHSVLNFSQATRISTLVHFMEPNKAATTHTPSDTTWLTQEALESTFRGYIHTLEDAYLLISSHMSGASTCAPRLLGSGSIFIYKKNTTGINKWPDELPWTNNDDHGNMSISYSRSHNLWRKAYTISVQNCRYCVVSYYNPWDAVDGTLKMPSQEPCFRDTTLRTDAVLPLQTTKPTAEHYLLYSELTVHLSVLLLV